MIARSARRNRELGLDEKTLTKAMTVIARVLEGDNHLARAEIVAHLARAKINTDGQRIAHILYRAELESLVCSGRRKGKHITFALFDERVPASRARPRDEAIAELARRYVATRWPATLQDFTWWCQLPAADAKAGFVAATPPAPRATKAPRALLLPPYDEYTVAYRDRSAIGAPPTNAKSFGESTLLGPVIVLDGKVVGTWRRALGSRDVTVTLSPWRKLAPRERAAIDAAAERYAAFVGRRAVVELAR
jgi:hypothetical protein